MGRLLIQAVFACLIVFAIGIVGSPPHPDFGILWAAHKVANPYSPAALEAVLGKGLKHFSYPPTFLPAIERTAYRL